MRGDFVVLLLCFTSRCTNIIVAGYTAGDLAESGLFTASDLLQAGFSLDQLAEFDPDLAKAHNMGGYQDPVASSKSTSAQQEQHGQCAYTPYSVLHSVLSLQPEVVPSHGLENPATTTIEAQPLEEASEDEVDVDELLGLLL